MCDVVITRFFMTISHFNENNDLGSSKALKWVLIKSSFFLKGLFFTIIMLFVLKSSKQDFVFGRTAILSYIDATEMMSVTESITESWLADLTDVNLVNDDTTDEDEEE